MSFSSPQTTSTGEPPLERQDAVTSLCEMHKRFTPLDSQLPLPATSTTPKKHSEDRRASISIVELNPSFSALPPVVPPSASLNNVDNPFTLPAVSIRHTRRILSCFLIFFSIGWGDSIIGVIIPHLKESLGLSYMLGSLLFVVATIGFLIGTFVVEPLMQYFGRITVSSSACRRAFLPPVPFLRRPCNGSIGYCVSQARCIVLATNSLVHMAMFVIVAFCSRSFAAILLAFFIGGIGKSIMIAAVNAYVALHPRTGGFGQLHCFFGLGAFAAPLICQSLTASGWPWERFFTLSIGVSAISFLLILFAFHATRDEFSTDHQRAYSTLMDAATSHDEKTGILSDATGAEKNTGSLDAHFQDFNEAGNPVTQKVALPDSVMLRTLRMHSVWAMSMFVCLYSGGEVVTHGFIVTFVLQVRNANVDVAGYTASGFWAGLAVSRLAIGYALPYIRKMQKHLVQGLILLALTLHVLIWQVQSFNANAAFAAFVGTSLGPIFPIILDMTSRALEVKIQLTAMAVMTLWASIGSALFPFVTGVLANAEGAWAVEPVLIGILSSLAVSWSYFQLSRQW